MAHFAPLWLDSSIHTQLRVGKIANLAQAHRRASQWLRANQLPFPGAESAHTRRVFEGAEMTALTVRLPDEKHRRLKALAKSRGTPLNRLIDDMTTLMLAEFDAETRFQLRSARGIGRETRGLELLGKAMAVSTSA